MLLSLTTLEDLVESYLYTISRLLLDPSLIEKPTTFLYAQFLRAPLLFD